MVVVEPISLAIGAVSLATLFAVCVECFDLVESGRNLGADYELLLVKLSIEKRRLMIWGEAAGVLRPDQDRDPLLDDPKTYELVERILMNVQKLFGDADALRSKYGLESASPGEASNTTTNGSSTCLPMFESSPFVQFQRRLTTFQRKAGLLTKTKWVIRDSSKFAEMIEHLRDLHDGLGHIATAPRTAMLKDDLVRREMQSIPDLATLKIIEETCSEADWKSSASAASVYLQTASYVAPAKRTYIDEWMDVDRTQQHSFPGEMTAGSDLLMPNQQNRGRPAKNSKTNPKARVSDQESFRLRKPNRPYLARTEVMIVCSSSTLIAWIPPRTEDLHFHPITHIPQPTPANRATCSRIMKALRVPQHYTSVAIYCPPRMRYVHLALCFVQEQLAIHGEVQTECHLRFDDRLLDADTCFGEIPDRMEGYHQDLEKFADNPSPKAQPLVDAIDMNWLERRLDFVTLPDYDPLSERLDWATIFQQSKDDTECVGIIVLAGEAACRSLLESPPVLPPDNFRGEGRVYRLRERDEPSADAEFVWKAEHHCNISVDKEYKRVTGGEDFHYRYK